MEVVKRSGEAQTTFPNQVVHDVSWAGVRQSGQSGAKRGKAGQSGAKRGAVPKGGGVWRSEAGTKRGGAMWTLVDKMGIIHNKVIDHTGACKINVRLKR